MRRGVRGIWIAVCSTCGALGLVVVACGPTADAPSKTAVVVIDVPAVESLPASRQATLAARDETLADARLLGGDSPVRLQRRTRRWAAGATITVAFRGGDERLRRRIAEVAALWTLHGNIGFDFGDAGGAPFRAWSPNDTRYTAQIRIGFDEPGYFSCVGDESVNAACAAPGQASMNYQGFDRSLPASWRGIVLHQFGHALGLEHERARPDACESEMRWDDQPGYRRTTDARGRLALDGDGRWPGIYTVLAGPPHGWSRDRVDRALRRRPASRAFGPGAAAPDGASVMRDTVDEWMLKEGRASRCFAPPLDRLSEGDERGMATMYPRVHADVLTAVLRQEEALASIRDAARLAPPLRRFVEGRIETLEALRTGRAPR